MTRTHCEEDILPMLMDNPTYGSIYGSILEYCCVEREESDAASFCDTQRISKTQIQSALSIISLLVKKGALYRSIFINGEVYVGSIEDLQANETIPQDATVQVTLQATQAGLSAATHLQNTLSFEYQTNTCPQRIPAFKTVLALCADAPGQSTEQIQEALKQNNMLNADPKRGIDSLHASYFTGILEKIGALTWHEKAWVTSEKGLTILGRP